MREYAAARELPDYLKRVRALEKRIEDFETRLSSPYQEYTAVVAEEPGKHMPAETVRNDQTGAALPVVRSGD